MADKDKQYSIMLFCSVLGREGLTPASFPPQLLEQLDRAFRQAGYRLNSDRPMEYVNVEETEDGNSFQA